MSLLLFLILTLVLLSWAFSHAAAGGARESGYLLSAVGAMVILIGLTTPWIAFTFLERLLAIGPEWVIEIVPGVLARLLRWLGSQRLEKLFGLVDDVGFIPGWALIVLIPARALWLRMLIALTGLVGLLTLAWFVISLWWRPAGLRRLMGALQALSSFTVGILLLLQVPAIDAWGGKTNIFGAALALMSGAEMGWGVWLTIFGLLIAGSGGLLVLQDGE